MTGRQILGWALAGGIAVIAAIGQPGTKKPELAAPIEAPAVATSGTDAYSEVKKLAPTARTKAEPPQTDSEGGMAIVVAKKIKATMNNPKSFDLESLIVLEGGAACYQYRATNAFNAVMPGKAVFDAKSGIIIIHTDNNFIKTWNRICAHKTGREIAAIAKRIAGL